MRLITTPGPTGAAAAGFGKPMFLGLCSVTAAAGLMFLSMGVGELFAAIAVLGLIFVVAVLVNPVLGIVTLLGTLLLGLPEVLAGTGRLTANNALGLVLLLALLVQIAMKRDLWFIPTPQVALLLLIAGTFVASLVHSWYAYVPIGPLPKDFTGNTLFLLFSRLAFLLLLVNFVNSERRVMTILLCLLGFTMVVIPSAFYNLATWTDDIDVVTGKPLAEFRIASDVSSWGQNENRLAFMCNVSILSIWMFAQIWKTRPVRVLGTAVILMLATLVLASGSRSGFLSLGLVLIFLLLQRGLARSFRYGVVGAVVVCALGFLLVLPPRASERLLNYSLDESERLEGWRSTLVRVQTNEHALEVFMNAPLLGVGPGNFRWLHRELYPHSVAAGRPTHNSYLWAATEGGALVVVLYLGLFYFIWRDLRAVLRRYPPDHRLWHVARFLTGYLMVFLFFSVFADFWLEPHLYLLAGLSMLVKRFALYEADSQSLPLAEVVPARA